MSFNKVIPYTSSVGSKFLIQFTDFNHQDFSIPVIDVSLVLVESSVTAVGIRDLISIIIAILRHRIFL